LIELVLLFDGFYPEALSPREVRVKANAVPVEGGLVLEADVAVSAVERFLPRVRAHVRTQARDGQKLAATLGAIVRLPVNVNRQHMLLNFVPGIEPIGIDHISFYMGSIYFSFIGYFFKKLI
jgi:hypothetical protein